ncbi:hypothetical protein [Psittacicella gerlachiana]|uniref:Uncharacterized protein n=1 Tax=Psittacicella gerlachiana TaxID=2028574 RepID=A0A3A1YM53_9GAMM|nr:hypothetical protein [Psittacicella gerlachiana]RIY38745.1 hypothetical protein CKF59_00300 [Psittacicella gerlachiana]
MKANEEFQAMVQELLGSQSFSTTTDETSQQSHGTYATAYEFSNSETNLNQDELNAYAYSLLY